MDRESKRSQNRNTHATGLRADINPHDGVGIDRYTDLARLNGKVADVANGTDNMELANSLRNHLQRADNALTTLVFVNDGKTRAMQKKLLQAASTSYGEALGKLEKAPQTKETTEVLKKLKEAVANVTKENSKVVELVESDLSDLAVSNFIGTRSIMSGILDLCDEAVKNQENQNHVYQAKADTSYRSARTILIAISLAMVILSVVVALFLTRSIVRPLHAGVEAANRLASGDLTAETDVSGTNEVSILLKAVNRSTEMLRGIIADVKKAADSVASASTELSASSAQMSRGVAEQASSSSQAATSGEEMVRTVMDVARNTATISDSAGKSAQVAKNGERLVEKTVQEIRAIASTAQESVRIVELLGDRSKEIGEIVGVIDDIAEQTNLLALNAAIEAARAGEHGRGFAVVADEVRKLAEKTVTATKQIGQTVGAIRTEVTSAVIAMNDTAKKVEAGVDLSGQLGEALHQIVEAVQELQTMIQQISSSAEEMSATSGQIARDIDHIAQISRESSEGTEHTTQSSLELAQLSRNLQQRMGEFRI